MPLRIWIDFTNSPHVPLFKPLICAMRESGHQVEVTARDFAQTLELCQKYGIEHTPIGRHRGASLAAKSLGMVSRSASMFRWARGREFDLAISHGSYDQAVASKLLRIRSVTMFDYEFAKVQHSINCRLAGRVVVPDRIPLERLRRYCAREKIVTYSGLKEEYYLHDFEPDSAVVGELGLDAALPIVVLRTPPAVSLYHRFENDLHAQLVRWLAGRDDVQVVALPRTDDQRAEIERLDATHFVVPDTVIDTQSLTWFADLVIGAGGTMNREAVVLGTPVYTTFRGRMGAVDESLIREGRMRLLEDVGQVRIEKKSGSERDRNHRDPGDLVSLLLNCS